MIAYAGQEPVFLRPPSAGVFTWMSVVPASLETGIAQFVPAQSSGKKGGF